MDVTPGLSNSDLSPGSPTSLALAVEAMRIRTGVCSNLLGENFCSRQQRGEGAKTSNLSATEISEFYFIALSFVYPFSFFFFFFFVRKDVLVQTEFKEYT